MAAGCWLLGGDGWGRAHGEEVGGNAGLGPVGLGIQVVKSAYTLRRCSQAVWTSGKWDRHLGQTHLGHWGPLSWASPKVAEPMGISRPSNENPGSVCFHSPVDRGHSVGWTTLPWHLEVPLRVQLCLGVRLRDSGNKKGKGASLGPARLGKLLQARRDLNLPTSG